jgi:hypothetical protein
MVVSCLCRVRQRDFTHYVYLCVCLHVRDMHAAARALPGSAALPHACGSVALSVFHALHACGSAGTFSLSPSRQRGGTWACRRRRVCRTAARSSLLGFAFESVVRVLLMMNGSVVLRPCGCCLCCHVVSDACARPGTAPHHLLAAATREVALEPGGAGAWWRWSLVALEPGGAGAWWRWSLVALEPGVAGGLGALASSWRGGDDLARRGLGALWRCPCGPPCVAVLSAMPSGALGALKRGA